MLRWTSLRSQLLPSTCSTAFSSSATTGGAFCTSMSVGTQPAVGLCSSYEKPSLRGHPEVPSTRPRREVRVRSARRHRIDEDYAGANLDWKSLAEWSGGALGGQLPPRVARPCNRIERATSEATPFRLRLLLSRRSNASRVGKANTGWKRAFSGKPSGDLPGTLGRSAPPLRSRCLNRSLRNGRSSDSPAGVWFVQPTRERQSQTTHLRMAARPVFCVLTSIEHAPLPCVLNYDEGQYDAAHLRQLQARQPWPRNPLSTSIYICPPDANNTLPFALISTSTRYRLAAFVSTLIPSPGASGTETYPSWSRSR